MGCGGGKRKDEIEEGRECANARHVLISDKMKGARGKRSLDEGERERERERARAREGMGEHQRVQIQSVNTRVFT